MIEIKDVNEFLSENNLGVAKLSFLSTSPERVTVQMVQPQSTISASFDRVEANDKAKLNAQLVDFLQLARDAAIDFAICPEYCCPWDALLSSVAAGVAPRSGALWSICCESVTPDDLAIREQQFSACGAKVILPELEDVPGRFVNILCHLFHIEQPDGASKLAILMQAKTAPMGGNDYERDALIPGRKIYRFGAPNENRLVCIICSDVLSMEFRDQIVPQLQTNTLLVHLQLNKDSAAPGFRDYRNRCCYISPRTTDILCLNWAAGTSLSWEGVEVPLVEEPKTIYYRGLDGIDGKDAEIIQNHRMGCFLTHWDEQRTAAYIFHPNCQVFRVRLSKPVIVGPAPASKRTGPRVEARYLWGDSGWVEATEDVDDGFNSFLLANPNVAAHLAPYMQEHVDLERLMEFGAGFVLGEAEFDWQMLRSFRLAHDDTASRLRLCWSNKGIGAEHRAECQRRFRALVGIVDAPADLPSRLAAFRTRAVKLTYEDVPKFRKFRNLAEDDVYGTVVFLGADPDEDLLRTTKLRLEKSLFDFNQDRQVLSVLYRDSGGLLVDYMDADLPAVNDDQGQDPTGIATA